MPIVSESTRLQILRFVLPLLTTALAVVVTRAVHPYVAPSVTPPFILAVAVTALYGGRWPGAITSVLSAGALTTWFFHPGGAAPGDIGRELMFVAVALVISLIAGTAHDQRRRAVAEASENDRLRHLAEGAAAEALSATRAATDALHRAEGETSRAREAEAALRDAHEASARLAAIVTSSSDAVIGKTLDGVVTSWNPAAERIFGYPAAEMVGQSIFRLIPPEEHGAERELLERLRKGESVEFSEAERIRSDGRRIWISLSVSPVRDREGRITGAASIKRDITAQRTLEERLRDTQRLQAVGQLAGGIAHEANNQMSVVLGGAHFLLRRPDLPEAARADVEQMRQAAERTAAITQQLLAFSRRQMLQLRELNLNDVVQSIGPVLRRTLGENQALVVRLGLLEHLVRADARQLEQVLLNLTLNARDAMPDGGQLTIETRELELAGGAAGREGLAPATYQLLTVADTGEGMDPATLEHIFDPFFTTKDIGRGTGLGLSVVHGIITQTGGHIRVDSSVGRGATFRVYLPAIVAARVAVAERAPDAYAPKGGSVALVVEDDALVRSMAARSLTDVGFTVLEAGNGEEAMNAVRQTDRLDVVVTDVGMPVMDGYALAKLLERERPFLPIVFMTGYGDKSLELRGPAPRGRLILKPFAPEVLVRAVGEALEPKP